VRYSSCPVLVTHGPKSSGALPGFRKILVPVDFSECSMQGLAYAKVFAKHFKSNITLLNSVHFEYYVASDECSRYDLPRFMQQAYVVARDQMRDLFEKTDWNGLEVGTSLQSGHPGQQICEHARDSRHGFDRDLHPWIYRVHASAAWQRRRIRRPACALSGFRCSRSLTKSIPLNKKENNHFDRS
jgi:nucleotide-binding universal stress UspA family protein